MGHYQNDYEHASADLVEYYGQPISYLDDSLDTCIIVEAQVHPEKIERRKNEYGWYLIHTRKIKFIDNTFKAEIRSDGVFTIGGGSGDESDDAGVDYSIEAILSLPGGRTQIDLTRAAAGEIGRPDYRR